MSLIISNVLTKCLENLYLEANQIVKLIFLINFRYADDTTLMAGSEEELKSLLLNVTVESEKVGLKLNIQKMKILVSGPITSWQIDRETVEIVTDYFWGLQNHCRW